MVFNRGNLQNVFKPKGFNIFSLRCSYSTVVSYENARPYEDIPSPPGLPLLKNVAYLFRKDIRLRRIEAHAGLRKELGDIYCLRMPGSVRDLVCFYDIEDMRHLITVDDQYPYVPSLEKLYDMRMGPLGHKYSYAGLVANGAEWWQFRKAVQQDLIKKHTALQYIDEVNHVMDQVIQIIEDKKDKEDRFNNMQDLIRQYVSESLFVMVLGSRIGAVEGSETGMAIRKLIKDYIYYTTDFLKFPHYINRVTGNYQGMVKASSNLFDWCHEQISASMSRDKKDGSLRGTVLGNLLERNHRDPNIAVIMAVESMNVGIETTANAATLLMYHLATNPEKQEVLFQEIESILGVDGKVDLDKFQKMKYLRACVQESIRLAPIFSAVVRMTNLDVVLAGYKIPKGTQVSFNWAVHSFDPDVYSDPYDFVPERWIRGHPRYEKVDKLYYLPFGHGLRMCLGHRFSKLELQLMILRLVQRYKLVHEGEPVNMIYHGVGTPDKPLNLKFIYRR